MCSHDLHGLCCISVFRNPGCPRFHSSLGTGGFGWIATFSLKVRFEGRWMNGSKVKGRVVMRARVIKIG